MNFTNTYIHIITTIDRIQNTIIIPKISLMPHPGQSEIFLPSYSLVLKNLHDFSKQKYGKVFLMIYFHGLIEII